MRIIPLVIVLACGAGGCSSSGPSVPPLAAASPKVMTFTTSSDEARQLVVQARDLLQNQEPGAAATLLDQAIARDAGFAMAHALRAQAGGFVAARAHLDEAVRLAGTASAGERHWILAARAQADADAPSLETHLDALLAEFPDDKHLQLQMGNYHRGIRGDDRAAATYFTRATEIDPAFAGAFNNLGYAQMANGDAAGAEASFKRYIELLPNRPNPYDSYAEFLMKQGRFDESIAAYRRALEKDPAFQASHTGIGANLIFKGDYERAREAFRKHIAVAARPVDKLDAMRDLAASYVYQGRQADAIAAFDDAVKAAKAEGRTPAMLNASLDIAAVLMEWGQAPAATARLQAMAAEIDGSNLPDRVKARMHLLRQQFLAQALSRQGKAADAEALVATLDATVRQRNNPFEADAMAKVRGLLALDRGKHADAAAAFEAISGSVSDPYVTYKRAVALEAAGRAPEAAMLYKLVATFNQHSLPYALVRAKAIEKVKA